jgi:hypothetical protein
MFLSSHRQALAHAQLAGITVQACIVMQAASSSDTAASDIMVNTVLPVEAKTGHAATIHTASCHARGNCVVKTLINNASLQGKLIVFLSCLQFWVPFIVFGKYCLRNIMM